MQVRRSFQAELPALKVKYIKKLKIFNPIGNTSSQLSASHKKFKYMIVTLFFYYFGSTILLIGPYQNLIWLKPVKYNKPVAFNLNIRSTISKYGGSRIKAFTVYYLLCTPVVQRRRPKPKVKTDGMKGCLSERGLKS